MNNQLEIAHMSRHFKRGLQMVKKHMKRCSTLLAVREMKTKTTDITICLSAFKIRNSDNTKCWWEYQKADCLRIAGGNENVTHSRKQFGSFFKNSTRTDYTI